MKKRLSLIIATAMAAVSLAGCGIVTAVPIGQEGEYTGKVEFNAAEQSGGDWELVVTDISERAVDLSELLNGEGIKGDGVPVKGSAEIIEYNTDKSKYFLLIKLDNGEEVKIQAGGVYSGTALRDAQTIKIFQDFTNQTEWSAYAKALNKEVDEKVVVPAALDAGMAGKKVTFVGAATVAGGKVTVTPIALTIE